MYTLFATPVHNLFLAAYCLCQHMACGLYFCYHRLYARVVQW